MAKRALNETEIEARYKAGEKPVDIAKDYKCCTSSQIRTMAHRRGWKQQKDEIRHTVIDAVANVVQEAAKTNMAIALQLERELLQQQLRLVQEGKLFYDFIAEQIAEHAEEESDKAHLRAALIQKLQGMYDSVLGRFLPSNVVSTAFKSARMIEEDTQKKGDGRIIVQFGTPDLKDTANGI